MKNIHVRVYKMGMDEAGERTIGEWEVAVRQFLVPAQLELRESTTA